MATAQPSITFYTNPQSRARIVRWMLEETGLEYEAKTVEYGPAMKSPEYLAMNPMGKVPMLTVNGRVITEVAAICTYLAELAPEKQLAPELGSPERADYLRWLFFVSGPLEALMTDKKLGQLAEPQSAGYGRYEDVISTLKSGIKGKDHLCGDHFTAADLLMVTNLRWYMSLKMIEENDEFHRYVKLHEQRPAASRAYELDGPIEMGT